MPAVRMGPVATVAPATPTTRPAVDTMPSLAPSTPARSQFSRPDRAPSCRSPGCVLISAPSVDQFVAGLILADTAAGQRQGDDSWSSPICAPQTCPGERLEHAGHRPARPSTVSTYGPVQV